MEYLGDIITLTCRPAANTNRAPATPSFAVLVTRPAPSAAPFAATVAADASTCPIHALITRKHAIIKEVINRVCHLPVLEMIPSTRLSYANMLIIEVISQVCHLPLLEMIPSLKDPR